MDASESGGMSACAFGVAGVDAGVNVDGMSACALGVGHLMQSSEDNPSKIPLHYF